MPRCNTQVRAWANKLIALETRARQGLHYLQSDWLVTRVCSGLLAIFTTFASCVE